MFLLRFFVVRFESVVNGIDALDKVLVKKTEIEVEILFRNFQYAIHFQNAFDDFFAVKSVHETGRTELSRIRQRLSIRNQLVVHRNDA